MTTYRIIRSYACLSTIAAMCLFTSCDIHTAEAAGEIVGMWQLERIDTLTTEGVLSGVDLREQQLFWSFSSQLASLVDKRFVYSTYYMHFHLDDNTLWFTEVYLYLGKTESLVTEAAELAPYGMNSLTDKFSIEQLNSRHLTLYNAPYRLYFNRY